SSPKPSDFFVAGGQVTDPATKKSLGFGELTQGQKLVKVIAADTPTTPASEWKIAGQSAPKVDGRAIVTGKHAYASDIRRPGMRVGKILRPPAFNAKLISVDTH